ncbi:FAD:protein FMN transferase [Pelistega ratti]|uniref:FAD:protein FMN transferase n=1 Tax=Pelistega ratti TaxID=2652177 RepID=UPI001358C1C2|nr:FAD:protein FMN transferase [Pelistega ratti]
MKYWLFCLKLSIIFLMTSSWAKPVEPVIWQGMALGAAADIRFFDVSQEKVDQLMPTIEKEIERLEHIFSLYQEKSVLNELNQKGFLAYPPADLLTVLSQSQYVYRLTKGKFDPSIQVLWKVYAEALEKNPRHLQPPSKEVIQQTLNLVDFSAVEFNENYIKYHKQGLALSLNAIAQGYITDKVTDIIRQAGIKRALINVGEIRGLDSEQKGEWQVGIKNPMDQESIFFTIPLQNGGVSTSGGYGTVFDQQGQFTHLFNPKTGDNKDTYQSVTVVAPTASLADALSTAFAVSSLDEIKAVLQTLPELKVWVVDYQGKVLFKKE